MNRQVQIEGYGQMDIPGWILVDGYIVMGRWILIDGYEQMVWAYEYAWMDMGRWIQVDEYGFWLEFRMYYR